MLKTLLVPVKNCEEPSPTKSAEGDEQNDNAIFGQSSAPSMTSGSSILVIIWNSIECVKSVLTNVKYILRLYNMALNEDMCAFLKLVLY